LKATALSKRVKVIVILVLTSNSVQSLFTPNVRKDRRQKTTCTYSQMYCYHTYW
jgi:hypothetical protein